MKSSHFYLSGEQMTASTKPADKTNRNYFEGKKPLLEKELQDMDARFRAAKFEFKRLERSP
ncbi:MAG: hypothetical protein IT342_10425 [Candidatus Melainabacteria bacterium]|nr:hypothetical protein [Candidatus Melainabacteria bacterium]